MYISTSHLPGPVNQLRDSEDRSPRLDKEKREAPKPVQQTASTDHADKRTRPVRVDGFRGDQSSGLPDAPYRQGATDRSVAQAGIADLIEGLALKIAIIERLGGLSKDLVDKLAAARLQFEQIAKKAQAEWAASGGKAPAGFTSGLQAAFDDLSASIAYLLESGKANTIPDAEDAPDSQPHNVPDLSAVFVQKIGNLANRLSSIQSAPLPESFSNRLVSYTKVAEAMKPSDSEPVDLSV